MEITVTLFFLPLNGLDVVLGIQWLEQLGPVLCDWSRLSLTITRGSRVYKIMAKPKGQGRAVSNSVLIREVTRGREMFANVVRRAQTKGEPNIAVGVQ